MAIQNNRLTAEQYEENFADIRPPSLPIVSKTFSERRREKTFRFLSSGARAATVAPADGKWLSFQSHLRAWPEAMRPR